MRQEIRYLRRTVVFTSTDAEAFGRALLAQFPSMVFFGGGFPNKFVPPGHSVSALACSSFSGFEPPDTWSPEIEYKQNYECWHLTNPPRSRYFSLSGSRWSPSPTESKWAYDGPTLDWGWLDVLWHVDREKEDKAFMRKVWRVLPQVAINRFKYEYPHLGIDYGDSRPSTQEWLGHDAVRWCSRGRTRMLAGCRRPPSDWTFPEDSPWYEGLEPSEPPEDYW